EFYTPTQKHASTPRILRKSRMRKRARTDLSGGRSAMSVPTGTTIGRIRKLNVGYGVTDIPPIAVKLLGGKSLTTTSAEDHSCAFNDLPPGTYTLTAYFRPDTRRSKTTLPQLRFESRVARSDMRPRSQEGRLQLRTHLEHLLQLYRRSHRMHDCTLSLRNACPQSEAELAAEGTPHPRRGRCQNRRQG
ncbi:MAG: hypothetical protein WBW03_06860, partial [Silvibacterium sp.]